MDENKLDFEKTLDESKMLLDDASRVADEDYEFTLESILSEFGGQQSEPVVELPEPKPAVSVVPKLPELPQDDGDGDEPDDEPEDDADGDEPDGDGDGDESGDDVPSLDATQSYSLKEVLERTVQEALDEQEPEEPPRRRGLFSRKWFAKADGPDVLPLAGSRQDEPEDEPDEPEPPIADTLADYRTAVQNAKQVTRFSALVTVLMWVPQILARFGWMPALYGEERLLNTLPYFIALALVCVLGREVFSYAIERLASFKVTYELLTALLCAAALCDTALAFLAGARADSLALPLHSVAALSMTCALYGRSLLFQALYSSFRVAAIGDPPYIVSITAGGAAKRKGSVDGFTVTAQKEDLAGRWQTIVLPVILVGALVFSVLSTVEIKQGLLYFWNLSAVLAGANTLAFPLVYPMPLRRLTRRFTACGSALAGWRGAEAIRRGGCLILTDSDLFPPGTVTLGGLKIFGEESGKVFSYAATMAHASETGISRLFDGLLEQEGGHLEPLSDLNFFDEGGVSGTIHGETVFFGTASFCRKMGVSLPRGAKPQTGMFLAVDHSLIAAFVVKYTAAQNVEWALHALHRAHITPVMAVRDSNITSALLKRKFGTDARAVYPKLSTRIALSEKDGANPCALIYREGLMPFAELAVGSKRLCRAVRVGNVLSLLASVSGTLLGFYLSFVEAYTQFTPFALVAFLGLWTLAALMDGWFVDQY